MIKHAWTVEHAHGGLRADFAVSQQLALPRNRVAKAIKDGALNRNGKSIKPHHLLKEGDALVYDEALVEKEAAAETPAALKILFENDDVLVIDKPSGLLAHPTQASKSEATVASLAQAHAKEIAKAGGESGREGLVHRLDRDVSGVMAIAKTPRMFALLKAQFADRTIEKEYLALVYGKLQKDIGTISFNIARSRGKGRMVARPTSQEGREAVTTYEVLERYVTATYVSVHIETGRTHQIRAHFKGIGYPIVGDSLYRKSYMKNIRPIALGRPFLHSHRLTFTLPDGTKKTVASPLPKELAALRKKLPPL